jgi:aspartate/methionine/tyrosine aminotransferase
MKETPIDYTIVRSVIDEFNLPDFGKATIREVVGMTNQIEKCSGKHFIRMEMGVPGLPAAQIGVKAEIEALQKGVASIYPPLDGIPDLKVQASRFVKAFINVDVPSYCCTPVCGSMQGTMASFITCSQRDATKNKILFIDPGFPVQKQQLIMLNVPFESFDVYNYRGEALREELERHLSKGDFSALVYSNPNNPAWFCLQDAELKIIGELATKYDVIVMEDLAYFAMDFRKDLGKPFEPPFQATAAHYTDNYILLISGSKAFSYAGQRIGYTAISEKLFNRKFKSLIDQYGTGEFGNVFVNRVLYSLSSGTSHSAQYALAAVLKAACDGSFDFISIVNEYGRRAERVKKYFVDNGFYIVYDNDLGETLADGFYFTVAYPGMTGGELMKELMFYGISTISLETTGSDQQGLRICTSFIKDGQYEEIKARLECFKANH